MGGRLLCGMRELEIGRRLALCTYLPNLPYRALARYPLRISIARSLPSLNKKRAVPVILLQLTPTKAILSNGPSLFDLSRNTWLFHLPPTRKPTCYTHWQNHNFPTTTGGYTTGYPNTSKSNRSIPLAPTRHPPTVNHTLRYLTFLLPPPKKKNQRKSPKIP